MGLFVYASTATGKSSLSKKYKNVIDMESTLYKYLDQSEVDESKKSTERKLNPDWPQNYFEALEKIKNKYDYILISDDICNEFLHKNNYDYIQVYPAVNLKKNILKDAKIVEIIKNLLNIMIKTGKNGITHAKMTIKLKNILN